MTNALNLELSETQGVEVEDNGLVWNLHLMFFGKEITMKMYRTHSSDWWYAKIRDLFCWITLQINILSLVF